jgi:hypothetical protein
MNEKKLEFLLKKIMYYSAHATRDFKRYSDMVDEEFEKMTEKLSAQPEQKEEPEVVVAPITTDEKLKLSEHKLFRLVGKYGFEIITLAKCKTHRVVADDVEGERFFDYLSKQGFGRIDRVVTKNNLMSVKFVFNKDTHDRLYGIGKG